MVNNSSTPGTNPDAKIKEWYCDGIRFTHTLSNYQNLESYKVGGSGAVVRLHFGVKGDYRVYYAQIGRGYDLIGGHHNILFSDPFDMEFWNKTLEIETFGIQFPLQLFVDYTHNINDEFKRFSGNIMKGKADIFSDHWGAIDLSIQHAINQVLKCQYQGEIEKLFLLSKSIELLALCAESYTMAGKRSRKFIKNTSDKEKIMAARDLINERIQSPPNLSEISLFVGLNEYKLKRGFKELFGTTVFNYLTDQRLNLARQFLLDTEKNVAEIGYELGYSTPQHFNNAFRKKFGTTPNLIRKNP